MVQEIDIVKFLGSNTPLIDVRSPGEFDKGHIPGAVNIPLFSDDERAQVGTVYVQRSKDKAIELGLQFVEPKLDDFIAKSKKVAPNGKLVVHCWRGGMRSRSFAKHLNNNGLVDVSVVTGGYKAYRTHLHNTFDISFKLNIVGGYTGSAKTLVIKHLMKIGFQAVDLEALAKHKGSAFGSVENQTQPTVEQFENNLFEVWRKLDYSQAIWLEDESHNIGSVCIPMNLFKQMRNSPVFFLEIPRNERVKHLVSEYADTDPEKLAVSIGKIAKRLDGQKVKDALKSLSEKKFDEVAAIALEYYDKVYTKGLYMRDSNNIFTLQRNNTNPAENAKSLMQFYEQLERH